MIKVENTVPLWKSEHDYSVSRMGKDGKDNLIVTSMGMEGDIRLTIGDMTWAVITRDLTQAIQNAVNT